MSGWLLYSVLALHFGFNIFFSMCFAAFMRAASESFKVELAAYVYMGAVTLAELTLCVLAAWAGQGHALWLAVPAAALLSLLLALALAWAGKCDFSLWLPFCLVFSPLVLYWALLFLLLFYRRLNRIDKDALLAAIGPAVPKT